MTAADRPRGRLAMTSDNIQRATVVASTPSSAARLRLVPVRAGQALLIATTDRGDQLDLLVVPPETAEAAACAAMARAADPAATTRAPGILTAMPAAPGIAPDDDLAPGSVWDNEGGHLA